MVRITIVTGFSSRTAEMELKSHTGAGLPCTGFKIMWETAEIHGLQAISSMMARRHQGRVRCYACYITILQH